MEWNLTASYALLSGLIGFGAFAFGNAFSTWFNRNKNTAGLKNPLSVWFVFGRLLVSILLVISMFFGIRSVLPYQVAEHNGVVRADNLFAVRSVKGFATEFPSEASALAKGDVLMAFRRSPDPGELAQAKLQRNLLKEQLRYEQLKAPSIDSGALTLLQNLQSRLNELNERERYVLQQQDARTREGMAFEQSSVSAEQRLIRETESIGFQILQQEAAVSLARQELESAEVIAGQGLVSRLEMSRKREALRIAESKLGEFNAQETFLRNSLKNFQNQDSKEGSSRLSYTKSMDEWLADINKERQTIEERLKPVEAALRGEEVAAGERQNAQINQIKMELQEVERVLAEFDAQPTIAVAAPWSGLVGYRDPSPSTINREGTPVAVMYEPESVYIALQLSTQAVDRIEANIAASADSTSHIEITNRSLAYRGVILEGRVISVKPLTNDDYSVHVSIDLPGDLLVKLADQQEIEMTVRFFNPVASIFGLSAERKLFGFSEPVAALALLILLATLLTIALRAFVQREIPTYAHEPEAELSVVTVSDIDLVNATALSAETLGNDDGKRVNLTNRGGD